MEPSNKIYTPSASPRPRQSWFKPRWLGRWVVEISIIFIGITLSFIFDGWRKERERIDQEREALVAYRRDLQIKIKEARSDLYQLNRVSQLSQQMDSLRDRFPLDSIGPFCFRFKLECSAKKI